MGEPDPRFPADNGTAHGFPRSRRSIRTGPGSRGGTYHLDPAGYHREWRRAHPEYRERERERKRRKVHFDELPLRDGHLIRVRRCLCPEHRCEERVVVVCGFCREGEHDGEGA
jgi:hypothetical protein